MSGNKMLGSAEQAKRQNRRGNSYSRNGRLEKDIEAYSKCEDWALLEEDCRRAIHLDSTIVEVTRPPSYSPPVWFAHPHHMLGVELLQRREFAEGIRELQKGELVRAKYSEWEFADPKESQKLRNLRKALNDVFRKAAKADKPTEVPSYLCCGITHRLFQEPVITPYGHTYEKGAIIRHLEENKSDPMTREPLDQSQLVPNLALKEAVQSFLDEHGWAYEEFIDDDDQRLKLSAKRRKLEWVRTYSSPSTQRLKLSAKRRKLE